MVVEGVGGSLSLTASAAMERMRPSSIDVLPAGSPPTGRQQLDKNRLMSVELSTAGPRRLGQFTDSSIC